MTTAPHIPATSRPPSPLRLAALVGAGLLAAGLLAYSVLGGRGLAAPPLGVGERVQDDEKRQRVRAPELDGGVAWLNSSGPLTLRDLRGKVVLIDFWTLCCINCIHVLPDLAKLEKKYPNELVVIGCHSAKFNNERNSESIRKAILRYEIAHPVVNDADMKIWRSYGIRSWPTLVLIDPEGYYVGYVSGEGNFDVLDEAIGKQIKTARERKTLKEEPLRFDLARFKERGEGPLFFPGKVLADAASDRLFIADSTHHRIVITDLKGKKIAVAGRGDAAWQDGPFDKAAFNDPQGMALVDGVLYVADRKNHLLRALDLKAGTVRTVAGTGEQGHNRRRGGPGLQVGLNSPWALHHHGTALFMAMAGHHQIWTYDLTTGQTAPYAGNGAEDITDGSLSESSFAQPSGLAGDGVWLYVADSEVSAIRAVPLGSRGAVKTVVGTGLFNFGDEDGQGDQVKLQHALGVAWHEGKLYVADTYNSKLKVIDPETRRATTFLGGGKGDPVFSEPAGLSIAGGKIYVADTNAHRVRVVDLKTKAVSTLQLEGVEAPRPPAEDERPVFPNPQKTALEPVAVPADGDLTLRVSLKPPEGFKLSPQGQMTYQVEALAKDKATWSEVKTVPETKTEFPIAVPAGRLAGADVLRVSLLYYECATGNQALCRVKSRVWDVPLKRDTAAATRQVELTGKSE
jgi:thiol-disulfide isomerase/thioredoxin